MVFLHYCTRLHAHGQAPLDYANCLCYALCTEAMQRQQKMETPKRCEFHSCAAAANRQVQKGNKIHQKFWCANCGVAQYIEKENVFYAAGKCEECGHVSDLIKDGCNYLLIATGDNVIDAIFGSLHGED